MTLKVFKFGGASVSTPERIVGMAEIVKLYSTSNNLVIIISAMGKTTNELEKVVEAFFNGNSKEAEKLFAEIKNKHWHIINSLIPNPSQECISRFDTICNEVSNIIIGHCHRSYDYYYDQVVGIGELLSTAIISSYFNEVLHILNIWVDVRDILKTDNNYRDVNILWNESQLNTTTILKPLIQKNNIIIIQGFIGSTLENESTTLGREGSDYTAAIFGNLLHAESQTIWKDVEGVMNADPKNFSDARVIPELSYNEVIEMAYYGAQVIHPKTMKPLHNKSIPLYVKCFLNHKLPGTKIHNTITGKLPGIIMQKNNQVLLSLISKDLSFVSEKPIQELYNILSQVKYKANLIQIEAVTILAVLDDKKDKIDKIIELVSQFFNITKSENKNLISIRHYTPELIERLTKNKKIILEQKTIETYQVLVD